MKQTATIQGRLNSLSLAPSSHQGGPDEQRSYLDRHHPQVTWIKDNLVKPVLKQLEEADSKNSSANPIGKFTPLTVAILGCSTGEECVRIFWELNRIEDPGLRQREIKIFGIDLNPEVVSEARRRINGTRSLVGHHSSQASSYATTVVEDINHSALKRSALSQSVHIAKEDITKVDLLPAIFQQSPNLIIFNHTLRILKPDQRKNLIKDLSSIFPDAILALGDTQPVISDINKALNNHLIAIPEISEHLTHYAFALPWWTQSALPQIWEDGTK